MFYFAPLALAVFIGHRILFPRGGRQLHLITSTEYHLAAGFSSHSVWLTMMLPPGHRRAMQRSPASYPLKIRQPKRGRAWECVTQVPTARRLLIRSKQEHCVTDRPSRAFLHLLIFHFNLAERKIALGDQQPSGVGLTALRAAIGREAYY